MPSYQICVFNFYCVHQKHSIPLMLRHTGDYISGERIIGNGLIVLVSCLCNSQLATILQKSVLVRKLMFKWLLYHVGKDEGQGDTKHQVEHGELMTLLKVDPYIYPVFNVQVVKYR